MTNTVQEAWHCTSRRVWMNLVTSVRKPQAEQVHFPRALTADRIPAYATTRAAIFICMRAPEAGGSADTIGAFETRILRARSMAIVLRAVRSKKDQIGARHASGRGIIFDRAWTSKTIPAYSGKADSNVLRALAKGSLDPDAESRKRQAAWDFEYIFWW